MGLLTTIGVAWTSAFTLSPDVLVRQIHEKDGPPFRSASEWRCWGGRLYKLEDSLNTTQLQAARDARRSFMEFDSEWPWVATALVAHDSAGVPDPTAFVEARGWPFLALRCELVITPADWALRTANGTLDYWSMRAGDRDSLGTVFPPRVVASGALDAGAAQRVFYNPTGRVLLPYRPFWPGLIANAMIYAIPFVGLYQLAGLARRAHRRKRMRCPWCDYDLIGLEGACPECGGQS